jgi:hypothetical protein
MIRTFLYIALLSNTFVFAEPQIETNSTGMQSNHATSVQIDQKLLLDKERLDNELKENNIWSKIYSNYHTYKELKKQKEILDMLINKLTRKDIRTKEEERVLEDARNEKSILSGKLQLLEEYENF